MDRVVLVQLAGAILLMVGVGMIVAGVGAREGGLTFRALGATVEASTPGLAVLALGVVLLLGPLLADAVGGANDAPVDRTATHSTGEVSREVEVEGTITLRIAGSRWADLDAGEILPSASTTPELVDLLLDRRNGQAVLLAGPPPVAGSAPMPRLRFVLGGAEPAGYQACAAAALEASAAAESVAVASLEEGVFACMATSEGRIAEFEVVARDPIEGAVSFRFTTWE